MPRRWDDDEERLPAGMVRIGYDADTQVYSYRDSDGSIWEGSPGTRYGSLTRVSGPPPRPAARPSFSGGNNSDDDDDDAEEYHPFFGHDDLQMQARRHRAEDENADRAAAAAADDDDNGVSWRRPWTPLLNFFLLVFLFLVGVWTYLHHAAGTRRAAEGNQQPATVQCAVGWESHKIVAGDTCWTLANEASITLEVFRQGNGGMAGAQCEKLMPGDSVCLPGDSEVEGD